MGALFWFKLYLLTIPVFFIIDILWLGLVARGFYRRQLGFILADSVNWTAAIGFYLIYICGILIFAVTPSLNSQSLAKAILMGALFGFFTYATYDLTNMATIADWPLKIVVVDIIWGTVLCALVSAAAFLMGRWLMG